MICPCFCFDSFSECLMDAFTDAGGINCNGSLPVVGLASVDRFSMNGISFVGSDTIPLSGWLITTCTNGVTFLFTAADDDSTDPFSSDFVSCTLWFGEYKSIITLESFTAMWSSSLGRYVDSVSSAFSFVFPFTSIVSVVCKAAAWILHTAQPMINRHRRQMMAILGGVQSLFTSNPLFLFLTVFFLCSNTQLPLLILQYDHEIHFGVPSSNWNL